MKKIKVISSEVVRVRSWFENEVAAWYSAESIVKIKETDKRLEMNLIESADGFIVIEVMEIFIRDVMRYVDIALSAYILSVEPKHVALNDLAVLLTTATNEAWDAQENDVESSLDGLDIECDPSHILHLLEMCCDVLAQLLISRIDEVFNSGEPTLVENLANTVTELRECKDKLNIDFWEVGFECLYRTDTTHLGGLVSGVILESDDKATTTYVVVGDSDEAFVATDEDTDRLHISEALSTLTEIVGGTISPLSTINGVTVNGVQVFPMSVYDLKEGDIIKVYED